MTAENSMVERVAESIAKSDGFHLGLIAVPRHNREVFRKRARAAIEAMREPTDEMLRSGAAEFLGFNDEYDPLMPTLSEAFQAMISTALQTEKGKG